MKKNPLEDVRTWLEMAELALHNRSYAGAAACLLEAAARLTAHLKAALRSAAARRTSEGRAA